MKTVILAGGRGLRISEESAARPKPMVEIGGRPILWHIMKIYSAHGFNDFLICCGYKGYLIKEYFAHYFMHLSDVTFDLQQNKMEIHQSFSEPWRVTLVDTGQETMTGGRLKRVREYIGNERFFFTYGDGVSNVDITALLEFHKAQDTLATVTAVRPLGRFGALGMNGAGKVHGFHEKPPGDGGWINGGFFVLEPQVIDFIADDATVWEQQPLETLAARGQLSAYIHKGFWQPMDTIRDRQLLEELWASGRAPWRVWPQQPPAKTGEQGAEGR